jgi:hypothetical protein
MQRRNSTGVPPQRRCDRVRADCGGRAGRIWDLNQSGGAGQATDRVGSSGLILQLLLPFEPTEGAQMEERHAWEGEWVGSRLVLSHEVATMFTVVGRQPPILPAFRAAPGWGEVALSSCSGRESPNLPVDEALGCAPRDRASSDLDGPGSPTDDVDHTKIDDT